MVPVNKIHGLGDDDMVGHPHRVKSHCLRVLHILNDFSYVENFPVMGNADAKFHRSPSCVWLIACALCSLYSVGRMGKVLDPRSLRRCVVRGHCSRMVSHAW